MKNVIAIIALVLVGVFVWVAVTGGVRVEIQNVGSTDITDVVVEVAGNEHAVGDVPAGSTESVKVDPTGTTKRVQVTWKSDGRECYGKLEVTFDDTGYKGTVHFSIDGVSVKEATEDLDTGFF